MNITPEQIRALRAGIEADRLAAEYIFEWKWVYRPATPDGQIAIRMLVPSDVEPPMRAIVLPLPYLKPWTPVDGECGIVEIVRPAAFSSDWKAMEQIVIQMRQQGWRWTLFCNEMEGAEEPWFAASFSKPARFIGGKAKESGAPLAAVKAALLALCAAGGGNLESRAIDGDSLCPAGTPLVSAVNNSRVPAS